MRWKARPALLNHRNDTLEPWFGQNQARRRLRDVRRRRDGDAHLCLPQSRRIVDAVTAHAHRVTAGLQRLDQPKFIFRKNTGVDRKILRCQSIRDGAGRKHGSFESDRRRDGCASVQRRR